MEAKTKRASGRGLYAEGDKNPHEHDGTVLETKNPTGTKKLYIGSLRLQMNFSDSEIVASVLGKEGYTTIRCLRGGFDLIEYLFDSRQGRANRAQQIGAFQRPQRKPTQK